MKTKVKNPGTKSFEMVKSACQDNFCCKLLCAFSTEMCGSIVRECCVILEKSGNLVLEEL